MLTKELETQVTVLGDGQLQQLVITIIKEDGKELSRSYHRKVIDVGDDVSGEDNLTKDIAKSVHTQARINARAQSKANANAPI